MSVAPWIAYLATFLGVTGHASSEFVAVVSGVSGPEASVWRYMLGGAGLVLIAVVLPRSRDLLTPLRERGLYLVWLSFFGVSLTYLAFHWALDFATIVQVGTMVTTIPIFVGIANLVINGQTISAPKLVAGGAAVIGVALLLTDGYIYELAGYEDSLYGVLLALACAAGGAFFSVMAKPLINEYGGIRIVSITLMLGGIGLWIIVGLFFGIWVDFTTLFDREPGQATALVTLALWNTTATQLLWFWGLATVPDITRGSYLFFLKPVITAFLGLVFLMQPITAIQTAAIVVICGAVLVELFWPRVVTLVRGRA